MAKNKLRPANRQDDTPFDKILASFLTDNPEEVEKALTEHELELRDRYVSIAALADQGFPDADVIRKYIKKQAKKGIEISRATAYRDLRKAQELFGEAGKTTRSAKRYALIQIGKRGLRLAEKLEDAKAYSAIHRNLVILEGLDKDETNTLDPEEFTPPTFVLQLNSGNKLVNFDLSKLGNIQDVDFEEIKEVAIASKIVGTEQMNKFLDELEAPRS